MKKTIFVLLLAIFVLKIDGYSQFNFSVSPGLKYNNALFGYKAGSFTPYLGIQYINANGSFSEKGQKFDYDLNTVVSYDETIEISGSVILPTLGAKYSFLEKDKINAYLTANVVLPVYFAKFDSDDEDDNEDFEEEYKDIKDAVSIWGAEFAFGAEYFFDEHFSVSGEFGLRHFHLKYDETYERDIWNPNTQSDQTVNITTVIKGNFNPTFSKISLNFYF